ncbi:MAG: hypothetical protein H6838_12515 [Planctomycetes bacterium]|nr:hypothetical protein [Planctomycetota bacterium]
MLEDDLTTWDLWWDHNKNAFLDLRGADRQAVQTGSDDFYLGATRRALAVDTVRPDAAMVTQVILPALRRAIDRTDQRDIQSSCLMAMAKIGRNHPDFTLREVFAPRLRNADQEVRETAALALGVAGIADPATLELMIDLVLDRGRGREASAGDVDERVRSFAAYGLGLLADAGVVHAVRREIFTALQQALASDDLGRNLEVAAIHAIGLCARGGAGYQGARLRDDAIETLAQHFDRRAGPGRQWMLAHCPTVIARLAGRDHARSRVLVQRYTAILDGSEDRPTPVQQSCALALGQLARPGDDERADDADREAVKALREASASHRDAQTRYFSLLALGQIGGADNRTFLLQTFDRARKTQEKPWCGIALGLLARAANAHGADGEISARLRQEYENAKEPGLTGALAVALGLSRALDAAPVLRRRLLDDEHQEDVAGYACIGLSLMKDRSALAQLRSVVGRSTRRPVLLTQATTALGNMGDQRIAEDLHEMLDGEVNLARFAAVAGALSRIGDRRSVDRLITALFDDERPTLARAFAAVALGGIADRRDHPWNTPIAVDSNYRAAVETFTDRQAGVLDIL